MTYPAKISLRPPFKAIETDVPPPEKGTRRGKYPFNQLKAGESVLIACDTKTEHVRRAANKLAREHGWKFRTRLEGDGVRVWRLS